MSLAIPDKFYHKEVELNAIVTYIVVLFLLIDISGDIRQGIRLGILNSEPRVMSKLSRACGKLCYSGLAVDLRHHQRAIPMLGHLRNPKP